MTEVQASGIQIDEPEGEPKRRAAFRTASRPPRTASPVAAAAALYGGVAVFSTVLAMTFLGMFSRPFHVPLIYWGDALSGGSQVKGTLENGWYETNPMLGAPHGQTMHDFPMADNMQFVFAKIFGIFSDQWSVVYNLCYLATYPLTAMAAVWFMRVVGCGRATAIAFGTLYAFTPYHFIHGQPHLALSFLFVVPLVAALILKVLSGRAIWSRRATGAWWDPRTWATRTTLATLAIVALVGTTSSYYSVFGLILLTVAGLFLIFRRQFLRLGEVGAAMVALMAVMLVNMAPDILYARSVEPSPMEFARGPHESEIYALKLAGLLLPVPWHRFADLGQFRLDYQATFPLPSETAVLGTVAAAGFLFLLVVPFIVTLVSGRVRPSGPFGRTQQHLAMLSLVAFLFGTIGGFATLFALLVSPDIRAWNRIVVYIALFALASGALLTETGTRWLGQRGHAAKRASRRVIAVGLSATILAFGLWDGAAPPEWSTDPEAVEKWDNDAAYVADVESLLPEGSSVFELPAMAFPESPPVHDVHDYDLIRPYLHSTDIAWSYGAVKGRAEADWQQTVAGMPVPLMVTALAASGFDGIHLDRFGYVDHDPGAVATALEKLLGSPVVSPDERFAFYDLRDFADDARERYGQEEWAELRRHTVEAPYFYWQPGFNAPGADPEGGLQFGGKGAAPHAVLDNPGEAMELEFSFVAIPLGLGQGQESDLTVVWPDGERESVSVDPDGTELSRRVVVPPGRSEFRLVGGEGVAAVNMVRFVLRDPFLTGLDLLGPAGEMADRAKRRAAEQGRDGS